MAISSSPTTLIVISVVGAMVLRVFPWPLGLSLYSPDWILLVIIYWCLATPERFGVGAAFLIGLVTDVLTGQLLGQHAFAYSIIAWLSVKLHLRLCLFPLSQQALSVLAMLAAAQLLILWTEEIQGTPHIRWIYWVPSLTGALLWPPVELLLSKLSRKHEIR